ncbi:GNAT family N-acetyltransferase [uncultured Enorma sp.]|uniref:GNAT family N-acetyltransferase n=1 Tax=uncultured Enorma sp. TaxID=1714346 RepID=UPI00260E11D4|nr:GNAT family N-acetyltransferase [uncultured Enorma sp.]
MANTPKAPDIRIRPIAPRDDAAIAHIARTALRAHGLDIPGTAYFDPELDHLSTYYAADERSRAYFVAADHRGTVLGGAGFSAFPPFDRCAEVQKLYVDDAARHQGIGTALMDAVEATARERGFRRLYLETHSNLEAALRLYRRLDFELIERPSFVQHSTMDCFFVKAIAENE